jgi:hypothetical protein
MLGFFKKKLPHCDTLFQKYFSPWYDEEDRPTMPRPDLFVINGFEGAPLDLDRIQFLPAELLEANKEQLQTMAAAALEDYQSIIQSDKSDLKLLHEVDRFYDRKRIADLLAKSDPADFSNDYMVAVCEFGATLGQLFSQTEGFGWLYSHPYFDSIIVHKQSGFGIPVFDWAIKKFSEYGVEDGFAAKFQMALDNVRQGG